MPLGVARGVDVELDAGLRSPHPQRSSKSAGGEFQVKTRFLHSDEPSQRDGCYSNFGVPRLRLHSGCRGQRPMHVITSTEVILMNAGEEADVHNVMLTLPERFLGKRCHFEQIETKWRGIMCFAHQFGTPPWDLLF